MAFEFIWTIAGWPNQILKNRIWTQKDIGLTNRIWLELDHKQRWLNPAEPGKTVNLSWVQAKTKSIQ